MDDTQIKVVIKDQIMKYVDKIDKLPLKPINKIKIIQRYVYSKIRWPFTVYKLGETWVKENIDDNILSKFTRNGSESRFPVI